MRTEVPSEEGPHRAITHHGALPWRPPARLLARAGAVCNPLAVPVASSVNEHATEEGPWDGTRAPRGRGWRLIAAVLVHTNCADAPRLSWPMEAPRELSRICTTGYPNRCMPQCFDG